MHRARRQEAIRQKVGSDQLTTDSRKVAEVHGKRHNDLLRLIRQRVEESGDWGVRNFAQTPYVDEQIGQVYQMFTMTQAGYKFLVGRMTGKMTVERQIAFIHAYKATPFAVRAGNY